MAHLTHPHMHISLRAHVRPLAFASVSKAAAAARGCSSGRCSTNRPAPTEQLSQSGTKKGAANRSRHLTAVGDREPAVTMQRTNAWKGCFFAEFFSCIPTCNNFINVQEQWSGYAPGRSGGSHSPKKADVCRRCGNLMKLSEKQTIFVLFTESVFIFHSMTASPHAFLCVCTSTCMFMFLEVCPGGCPRSP